MPRLAGNNTDTDTAVQPNHEGADLRDLLRLAHEPCLYLDDLLLHRILVDHLPELTRRLEQLVRAAAAAEGGTVTAAFGGKTLFNTPAVQGDVRVMPFQDGADMTVKVIGTNETGEEVPDKISVGKCLVLHPNDHYVRAVLDVCVLSSLRTGLGVLLAWTAAYGQRAPRLGVIGAGRVGFYTALAFHRAGLAESCAVFDPSPAMQDNFEKLSALEGGPAVTRRDTLEELLADCDAVVLATSAETPILGRAEIEKYALDFVGSVGADADNLWELADDIPGSVQLMVGSPLCPMLGDLKRWQEQDLLKEQDLTYVHQVLTGRRELPDGPVCYISTGFPLLDHVVAQLAYEVAVREGLGQALEASS